MARNDWQECRGVRFHSTSIESGLGQSRWFAESTMCSLLRFGPEVRAELGVNQRFGHHVECLDETLVIWGGRISGSNAQCHRPKGGAGRDIKHQRIFECVGWPAASQRRKFPMERSGNVATGLNHATLKDVCLPSSSSLICTRR